MAAAASRSPLANMPMPGRQFNVMPSRTREVEFSIKLRQTAFGQALQAIMDRWELSTRDVAGVINDYMSRPDRDAFWSSRRRVSHTTIQHICNGSMPKDVVGFVDVCRAAFARQEDETRRVPAEEWDILYDIYGLGGLVETVICDAVLQKRLSPGMRTLVDEAKWELVADLRKLGMSHRQATDFLCRLEKRSQS